MNILVLTPALYGTSPGQRFRIEQWARHLGAAGFRFEFVSFEDHALHKVLYEPGQIFTKAKLMMEAVARRIRALGNVRDYDVIYVYREASLIGPALIERFIAWSGVPVVYDFDDPIWMPYVSPPNGVFSRLKSFGKTETICRRASVVTVGNRLLAECARQFANDVRVMPSTIDLEAYPEKGRAMNSPVVTLGWTGSHSTLPFLRMIESPLREPLRDEFTRLLVIAHSEEPPFTAMGDRVVTRRWRAETEAVDLHEMDIGLAPFPNTGWTPWRCHGKILQYMAVGMPVVASRIGIIPDYIEDRVNGFLVDTSDEWVARIRLLMSDPELRARMGSAGRRTIEERYSSKRWAPELGALFRSIAEPGEIAA